MTESDDWDELNRELGVSKPAPGADEPAAEEAELPEAEPFADEAGEAEDAGDAEGGEEGESGAEGGPEEGPPGTGRKRRRRRRRKKKGPGEGLAAPAESGDPAGEEEEREPAPSPAPRRSQPVAARAATPEYAEAGEDEGEDEGVDAAGETLAAEEDAGGELLRDLIANWDVPAWDQVIGGLHRPGR